MELCETRDERETLSSRQAAERPPRTKETPQVHLACECGCERRSSDESGIKSRLDLFSALSPHPRTAELVRPRDLLPFEITKNPPDEPIVSRHAPEPVRDTA